MTGATGYIGKHLLARLILEGHHITAIVRAKNEMLDNRLYQALAPFDLDAQQIASSLTVIAGDVSEPGCQISERDLQRLQQQAFDGFLHSAGLTRFEDHLEPVIRRNNIDGVKAAYELSQQLNIAHFHHVSTAYVIGDYQQSFGAEHLDVGQGFQNPYERSKFEAEQFLTTYSAFQPGTVHIYRPSIVVGGHAVGENNTVSTIYVFLKSMHFIRECCRRDLKNGLKKFASIGVEQRGDDFFIPLRVQCSPDATINLVSVHKVVDHILAGLNVPQEMSLTTQMIVGTDFTLDRVRQAFTAALSIQGIELVNEATFELKQRHVFEEKFFRSTRVYLPYMHNAPCFSGANTPEDQGEYRVDPEWIADVFLNVLEQGHRQQDKGSLNKLALDVLGVQSAHDYFERFINQDLGESFLKRIPYVDSRIRFRISGDAPFDEMVHFDRGQVRFVPATETVEADCTYEIDQTQFKQIVDGSLDIRQAFFAGKIKISGNMEIGLKFGFLFGEHYRNIDDRVIEEVTL